MADHTAPEVLARLATLEQRLGAQEATIRHQGAELAYHRGRRRYRRAARRALPLVLAALLVALVPLATLAANPFTDLTGGPHDGNIDAIYNAGITKGCDPTSYCPTENVTREEMASFLARTAGLGGNPPIANALTAQTATNATNAINAGNANTVGGYAPSGLVRVARATAQPYPPTFFTVPTTAAFTYPTFGPVSGAAVTLQAPGSGLVLVSATVTASPGSNTFAAVRLRDASPGAPPDTVSPRAQYGGHDTLSDGSLQPVYVFPVTGAGPRTFVLETARQGSGTIYLFNITMTALFVPFGAAGDAGAAGSPDSAPPSDGPLTPR